MQHELVSRAELAAVLQPAMLKALEGLAPIGSNRSVPANVMADALVNMLATFLVAANATEVDRLTELFRARLLEAIGQQPAGHA